MAGGVDRARIAQKQASATIDERGASLTVAKVHEVYPGGKVNLKRSGNQRADGTWPADGVATPVLNPSQRISAGDMVVVAHYGGKALVMGRTTKPGDRDVQDLSANKLERNGSQDFTPAPGAMLRINKGLSTDRIVAELYKDFGTGIQSTALRFHQSNRYWQRIEADHNGISFFTGDPASLARIPIFVADAQADNGATIKNNRERADNARLVADDAWTRANNARGVADDAWNRANNAQRTADSKVGQHHHIFTRTNWTNFLHSDGRTYMISGFWEDRPTSGVVF